VKILHDEGGGVTELSKEFFYKYHPRIGRIYRIICSQDERTFNTEISGDEGVMLLSGFSVGYPGTGPRGLEEILKALGWIGTFREIASTDKFEWRR